APISSPVVFQSGPGRFEVAAADIGAARTVTNAAEDAWRWLAGPLGLPEGFSSPILVRLVPALAWPDRTPFRVTVEPGGIVSLRMPWSEATADATVQRAVVEGLLMRLAVAQYGVNDRLVVPAWLELGCVGWWQTHANPASLDAARFAAAVARPARVAEILGRPRTEADLDALAPSAA